MLSRRAGVPRAGVPRRASSPNPEAALPAPLPLPSPSPPSSRTRASRLRLSYRAARSKAPGSPLRARQPVSRTRASLRPEGDGAGGAGVSLSGRGGVARVRPGVRRAQTCWRCAPDLQVAGTGSWKGQTSPTRALGTESGPGRWRPGFQALVEDVPGARRWRETSGRTPRPCAGSTHAVRSASRVQPSNFSPFRLGRFLPAPLCPGGDREERPLLTPGRRGKGSPASGGRSRGPSPPCRGPRGAVSPTCCSWLLRLLALGGR